MTLQASGPISLLDIQNEFGGSNPIGINEYYQGGLVPSGQGVPSSGTISFSNFYGKSNVILVTAPSNTILYNVDVYQALVNSGWDKNLPAVYTVPATTYITSTTTASPALRIAGTYPNGITIVNNGYILGRGGNGGGNATAGGAGGDAIYTVTNVTIDNKGTIAGGGGGGGGGKHGDWVPPSGGGGSGGAPFGATGHGGYYSGGSDATLTTAGIVDSTTSFPDPRYGTDRWGLSGGPGGGWGQPGTSGNSAGAYGGGPWGGGKAGKFIDGYDLVNFTSRGTLTGEFKFSGLGSFTMSTIGINAIVGGGPLLSTFVVSGGNKPSATALVDDGYWGRIDPRKNGFANFDWYLFGVNLMTNFYINSNSLISTGSSTEWRPSITTPSYPKIWFNGQDLQTYDSWLNITATSDDAFRIYYGAELYGQPGVYDTKELVFFNPQRTGGKMILLIKCGGNGSLGAYQGGGFSVISSSNGTGGNYFNFASYMGAGKNVLLIGDSNGYNWQAFNGYLVKPDGTAINS